MQSEIDREPLNSSIRGMQIEYVGAKKKCPENHNEEAREIRGDRKGSNDRGE